MATETVTFIKLNYTAYDVMFGALKLGVLALDVDGEFYFIPENGGGCWAGWLLRTISEKLHLLNHVE